MVRRSVVVSGNIKFVIFKLLNMYVESIRGVLISLGTKIFKGERRKIKNISSK